MEISIWWYSRKNKRLLSCYIKLAPQKVFDLFKGIFATEKQDELERQRLEQEKIQAERKAKEQARLEKQKLKNSPEYKKRRADRDAR